jgi:hypothetical protein
VFGRGGPETGYIARCWSIRARGFRSAQLTRVHLRDSTDIYPLSDSASIHNVCVTFGGSCDEAACSAWLQPR